jgi:hypothetical protein
MVTKGWTYTELINMSIAKRDWMFNLFEEMFKPEESEEN